MTKKAFMISFFALLYMRLIAFDLSVPVGGRSAGMGRTAACCQNLWSIFNNPAGIASVEDISLGLYYENVWMLKTTSYKSGAFVLPLSKGAIGVSVSQFGYTNYNENRFGLAYARAFSPYVQIGLQLDYLMLSYGNDYGRHHAVTFDIGLQSQVTERLRLGVHAFNPVRIDFRDLPDNSLPITLRLGLAYTLIEDFTAEIDIEKNTLQEGVNLRAGVEYIVFDCFALRAGVESNPGIFTFGAGYEIHFVEVNIATRMHPVLGASIQAGLIFSLHKHRP